VILLFLNFVFHFLNSMKPSSGLILNRVKIYLQHRCLRNVIVDLKSRKSTNSLMVTILLDTSEEINLLMF